CRLHRVRSAPARSGCRRPAAFPPKRRASIRRATARAAPSRQARDGRRQSASCGSWAEPRPPPGRNQAPACRTTRSIKGMNGERTNGQLAFAGEIAVKLKVLGAPCEGYGHDNAGIVSLSGFEPAPNHGSHTFACARTEVPNLLPGAWAVNDDDFIFASRQ